MVTKTIAQRQDPNYIFYDCLISNITQPLPGNNNNSQPIINNNQTDYIIKNDIAHYGQKAIQTKSDCIIFWINIYMIVVHIIIETN